MSLDDRDWYREAIAERDRKLHFGSKKSNVKRPDVDFPALFRQEERKRSARQTIASSAWGSVFLAGLFVVVLVGLGVWAIKLVRVFS